MQITHFCSNFEFINMILIEKLIQICRNLFLMLLLFSFLMWSGTFGTLIATGIRVFPLERYPLYSFAKSPSSKKLKFSTKLTSVSFDCWVPPISIAFKVNVNVKEDQRSRLFQFLLIFFILTSRANLLLLNIPNLQQQKDF